MASSEAKSVLIVAGEASSGAYALRLLELWKSQGKNISAFGVGTLEMEAAGFKRIARSEDLAVVGITEVFRAFKKIYKGFHLLLNEAKERKPDFAVLMDLPDFNLRLAKKLKKQGIPVVYYISPQIWAWRKGRVKTIKKYVDKMLVLFPFEVDFYREHGVEVEFVGHPLLDEIREELFDESFRNRERQKYGVEKNRLVLGLMPGSRRSEINHHLVIQVQTAAALKKKFPELAVMLLVAPTLKLDAVKKRMGNIDFPMIVIKRDPFEMIALTDIVICASGTATLMVGLLKKPMVIMYIMSQFTVMIGRLIIKFPQFFGLSNIVLGREQSKELFQDDATVERLVAELSPIISDPAKREQHIRGLSEIRERLGRAGATERVAKILEGYFR